MELKDKLIGFSTSDSRSLDERFDEIATAILYDGYVKVRDEYRIYVKTVEFYFHSEENSNFQFKESDPIVYHRNGKFPGRNLPYFPVLSLHAHSSGYDITFENEKLKYRASALIRAYAVYDIKTGEFLHTKKKISIYDDRSTFLYNYINGFSAEGSNDIMWIDEVSDAVHELNNPIPRRNVFKYIGEDKQKDRDDRLWSYTRKNDVTPSKSR